MHQAADVTSPSGHQVEDMHSRRHHQYFQQGLARPVQQSEPVRSPAALVRHSMPVPAAHSTLLQAEAALAGHSSDLQAARTERQAWTSDARRPPRTARSRTEDVEAGLPRAGLQHQHQHQQLLPPAPPPTPRQQQQQQQHHHEVPGRRADALPSSPFIDDHSARCCRPNAAWLLAQPGLAGLMPRSVQARPPGAARPSCAGLRQLLVLCAGAAFPQTGAAAVAPTVPDAAG